MIVDVFNAHDGTFKRSYAPTPTTTLPPISEVMEKELKRREPFDTPYMRTPLSKHMSWEDIKALNKFRQQQKANDEEKTNTIINNKITPSDLGSDVVMIENTSTLNTTVKQVYDILINEFEQTKMSKSAIYNILQSIPFVDVVEDVIVIYTKMWKMFDKVQVPCLNIAKALRRGFHNEQLKVKFIPYESVNIAEYFAKTKWNL